jgi:hypothetical protein
MKKKNDRLSKKNEQELWVQDRIVRFHFRESTKTYPEGDSARPYFLLSDIMQVAIFVTSIGCRESTWGLRRQFFLPVGPSNSCDRVLPLCRHQFPEGS